MAYSLQHSLNEEPVLLCLALRSIVILQMRCKFHSRAHGIQHITRIFICLLSLYFFASFPLFLEPPLVAQLVKNLPAMQETPVRLLDREDPLEKGQATHSRGLGPPLWLSWPPLWLSWQCWRPGFDPWVGKILWRRERLPTPIFWPGKFQRLYIPW